jgi:hypothetical protein
MGDLDVLICGMDEAEKKRRALIKRVTQDGLKIQHRFKAEPLFARTGKGYMASEGVTTIQKIKQSLTQK